MSCSYAEGLSPYENKGRLGVPEKFDSAEETREKIRQLAEWVKKAKHVVVHTGAGISTSAGIPDFRGPQGVWTLEEKGKKPAVSVDWDDARPTPTHMALARLVEMEKVKLVITQNIDGLHLRSGIPRTKIAELHGNMFVDQCDKCKKMFVRGSPAPTVGQKYSGGDCLASKESGRKCRGKLKDFVLDWEANLPDDDLNISESHSMMADLSIVMGSTLQIIPAGNLPTYTQKYQGGKLVICNLQPTKHTKKADLNIHTYVDDVMRGLMEHLGQPIPQFDPAKDPVRRVKANDLPDSGYIDWTQCAETSRGLKKSGDKIHDDFLARKRAEKKRKAGGAPGRLATTTDDTKVTPAKLTKMQKREQFIPDKRGPVKRRGAVLADEKSVLDAEVKEEEETERTIKEDTDVCEGNEAVKMEEGSLKQGDNGDTAGDGGDDLAVPAANSTNGDQSPDARGRAENPETKDAVVMCQVKQVSGTCAARNVPLVQTEGVES